MHRGMELHPSPFTHCIVWSTDPGHPPRIWILDIFELVRGGSTDYVCFHIWLRKHFLPILPSLHVLSIWPPCCQSVVWPPPRRHKKVNRGMAPFHIGQKKEKDQRPLACWLEIGWNPKMRNCKCECIATGGADGQLEFERYKSVQKQAAFSCSIELLTQQEKVALEWPR